MRDTNAATFAVRAAATASRRELLALIRRAGVNADAEDVLQCALERALVSAGQLRDPNRVTAWLRQIVRNVAIDQRRKHRAFARAIDEHDAAADQHDDDPPCWCVLAQAGRLEPRYAYMLRRVDIEGARVIDIAAELGITPNNAMVRLHRARTALRKRMQEHCGTTTARSCSDCGCEERGCCPQPA
jgi:RNA polymerase sigma factor (sigma-70 family)